MTTPREQHAAHIETAARNREALIAALRNCRERRQLCSRSFGPVKQAGGDLGALKTEMQSITDELAMLQAQLDLIDAAPGPEDAGPSTTQPACQAAERDAAAAPLTDTAPIQDVELVYAVTSIEDVPDWARFVDAHPLATLYHDARWPRLMTDVFGHAHHVVTCRHDGVLQGVLPLVRQRSRLFGDFLTSLPFVNYGGALASQPDIEVGLMQEAGRLAAREGCRHVEFRDVQARAGWPSRAEKVSMRLALPGSTDALWKDIGSKLRAQVRRPEREGATTEVGGPELLDEFYTVFCRNMRDLGTPVYSRRWFAMLLERFAHESAIIVVTVGAQPVAAGLLVRHRRQVEIPWASTVREYNRYGVNMQLYWRCLCWAIEQGATEFDFGRSSIDAGTHRFKAQWGAREVPLHWHYWLPEGTELPQLNPQNRKFQLAIAAWQRLPVRVSRWLGPPIVKYLP